MAIAKILTYDHERIITACHAEIKDNTEKETLINDSLNIISETPSVRVWKLEDNVTGALLGYEIQDVSKNSIKRFVREGK